MVRKKIFTKALLALGCAMGVVLFLSSNSFAATKTWTGAIDSNMGNSGNWIGGVPVNGDDIVFDASVQGYNNAYLYNDIGASLELNSIRVICEPGDSFWIGFYQDVIKVKTSITSEGCRWSPSISHEFNMIATGNLLLKDMRLYGWNDDIVLAMGAYTLTLDMGQIDRVVGTGTINAVGNPKAKSVMDFFESENPDQPISQINYLGGFSGTVNIGSMMLIGSATNASTTINVNTGGMLIVMWGDNDGTVIASKVNINNSDTSVVIVCTWDSCDEKDLALSNIKLNTNTTFELIIADNTTGGSKINLTGLQLNGHCVNLGVLQYEGYDNQTGEGGDMTTLGPWDGDPMTYFAGVPAGGICSTVLSDPDPDDIGAPNTGSVVAKKSALFVMAGCVVCLMALVVVRRESVR